MNLKIVNLHDNPIVRIDTLQSLSCSNSIVALTMYDTPLSLKRNYRHHMVNSLWSLKALDQYVIADDEIIEDAHFGSRFRAMKLPFSIQLANQLSEVNTGLLVRLVITKYKLLHILFCRVQHMMII